MRPRHGSGRKVPARELQQGDVLTGSGWTVFVVQEIEDGATIKVSFTAVGGRLRDKSYDPERLVEVVQAKAP